MGKRSGNTVFFIVKDKFVTFLLPSSSWLLRHLMTTKTKNFQEYLMVLISRPWSRCSLMDGTAHFADQIKESPKMLPTHF